MKSTFEKNAFSSTLAPTYFEREWLLMAPTYFVWRLSKRLLRISTGKYLQQLFATFQPHLWLNPQ